MQFFRSQRVKNLIRNELGQLMLREVELPDTLATITDVDVNKKMDRAIVKVSFIPSENAEESLRILEKATHRLQFTLLRKINIKPMPKLMFTIDNGPQNAAAVERALLQEEEKEPTSLSEDIESTTQGV